MNDYEMDEATGLGGLPYKAEGEKTANITDVAASQGALPFGVSEIQSKYGELLKKYESSNQSVLDQIAAARKRVLSRPTEKSKEEYLRGLALALTTPPERTDPRFYERKNLFTFLRDVGAYGVAEDKAAKEAKLKREEELAKIDELKARYERESTLDLLKELEPSFRASMKPAAAKKEEPLPANIREVQYYEKIRDDETQPKANREYAARMLEKLSRIPSEKGEPDPNRPSSVVINRVSTVVNRDLKPVADRLSALNETRAAIANARTNPAQVPQVDRFFARLSGDSQLSQLEVNAVANAGSFPSRISNQLNKFFSGVPTDLSLDDKAQVLEVLEKVLAPSYNSRRNQILSQFSVASDISPEAVERIVGPRYLSAEDKRKLQEQATVTPPAEAIDMLKKNPNLAPDFDKKYGAGSAKKYLGG